MEGLTSNNDELTRLTIRRILENVAATITCMIPSFLAWTSHSSIAFLKSWLKTLRLRFYVVSELKASTTSLEMVKNECMKKETVPDIVNIELEAKLPICGK
jgi:hypothetical protein